MQKFLSLVDGFLGFVFVKIWYCVRLHKQPFFDIICDIGEVGRRAVFFAPVRLAVIDVLCLNKSTDPDKMTLD